MIPFTLVMAYYENSTMLVKQIRHTNGLLPDIHPAIRVMIVDDGSPEHPAADVLRYNKMKVPVDLYRIKKDVRWNQDAARNIGVRHAATGWFLLTDMDHLVPDHTWRYVMSGALKPDRAYTFTRVDAPDMTPTKHHPNTWAIHCSLYWRIGGYDERFAGYYGSDGDFRDRLRSAAPIEQLAFPVIRVPREVVADASTTRYGRKEPIDREAIPRIKRERAAQHGWKPLNFRFEYEKVLSCPL